MEVQGIGLVTLLFGLTAFGFPNFAFIAFSISTLLGSAAAVYVTFLGAANIQPGHLMLGFLTLGLLTQRHRLRDIEAPKEAFWLGVAALYGIGGAYFLPRFFAGQTYVTAVGATEFGFVPIPVPLGPTSGNITQSIYFAGDLVCFLISYIVARRSESFRLVFWALLAFCLMNIVFAFLDIITYLTGTIYLLDFIRNSTYTLHFDTEIAGMKRIAGSFTETSSFSYVSLGSLGFTTRLLLGGVLPAITLPASIVTLVLLVLSTSSTAYVGLPALLAILLLTSAFRAVTRETNGATVIFVIMVPLSLFFLVMSVLMSPDLSATIYNWIDISILSKANSDSGIERAQWNAVAMQNFFDTYGFGVGIGSVRASSFVVAVIANMGVFGGAAFFVFLIMVVLKRTQHPESFEGTVQSAAQMSCIGMLIAATISGAMVDLGLTFFIMAGVAVAATKVSEARRTVARSSPRMAAQPAAPPA